LDGRKKIESVRIETPLGNIESDSGNHFIDVVTIVVIILIVMAFKNLYFKGK